MVPEEVDIGGINGKKFIFIAEALLLDLVRIIEEFWNHLQNFNWKC